MVKLTIDPAALKAAVERLEREEGRSEADLVREVVTEAVSTRRPPRPRLPLLPQGVGDPTIAERADEILAEELGHD